MSLGAAGAEDIGSWFPESLTKQVENGGSLYDGRAEQGVRVQLERGQAAQRRGFGFQALRMYKSPLGGCCSWWKKWHMNGQRLGECWGTAHNSIKGVHPFS